MSASFHSLSTGLRHGLHQTSKHSLICYGACHSTKTDTTPGESTVNYVCKCRQPLNERTELKTLSVIGVGMGRWGKVQILATTCIRCMFVMNHTGDHWCENDSFAQLWPRYGSNRYQSNESVVKQRADKLTLYVRVQRDCSSSST